MKIAIKTCLIFLILASPVFAQENIPSFYRESWAVVIGINEYKYMPKLKYAVADAKAIKDFLITELGFKSDKVIMLLDNWATKDQIRWVLGDYLADETRVKENDRVFIFFAGHGITKKLPEKGQMMGFLAPVGAKKKALYATCISMEEIRAFSKLIPAKHVLFVVDSCYSGIAGITPRKGEEMDKTYLLKFTQEKAREILTAGQKDEVVVEGDEWGHSVFTKGLLDGLKGIADVNNDGAITFSELHTYLQDRVSKDSDNKQTPQAYTMEGDGQFVFILKEKFFKAQEAILGEISVTSHPPSAVVSLDGQEIGNTPLMGYKALVGEHQLTVKSKGFQEHSEKLLIEAGKAVKVYAALTPLLGAAAVEVKVPEEGLLRTKKFWKWTSLGAGVVLGAASGILYARADANYDKYLSATRAEDARNYRDKTYNNALGAGITGGAGVISLIVSGVLFYMDTRMFEVQTTAETRKNTPSPLISGERGRVRGMNIGLAPGMGKDGVFVIGSIHF